MSVTTLLHSHFDFYALNFQLVVAAAYADNLLL